MRFAVALAFFSIFAADMCVAGTDSSGLENLLARSREASGAPYRHHIVSVSHETLQGRSFEVTTQSDGSRFMVRRCIRTLCSGSYYDGERNFGLTFNDSPVPLQEQGGRLSATLEAIVSYAFTAPAFRESGGEVVERRPVMRDGKRYRRIAVGLPRGAFLDALVDPRSALVAGVISDDGRLRFELNDVRRIDGVALPFSIVRNGTEVERFERRSLVSGALDPPTGVVPQVAAGAPAIAMLKRTRASDQPIVPCSIGGNTVACLLDTGNSGLSMSLELAEALNLEPRAGTLDITGIGRYLTGIVSAPALSAGPATYPSADYAVLHDLHQYGYDVILGADAFARARVTIDYGKREVTFAPAGDAPAGDALALTFENFIPVISVNLGDVTAPLALDTGDESSINLGSDYFADHRTLFEPRGSRPVSGIGGASDETTGVLPILHLGEYVVLAPPIAATVGLAPTAKGHLGSGLLAHFAVTFDYAHSRLELRPRPGDPAVRKNETPPR